jgi:hypothetical protein
MQENTHGGKRQGAGAKRKAETAKTETIFLTMIKEVKDVETDEEARLELAKTLYSFERGQMFIAELTEDEIKKISSNLEQSY